MTDAEVIQQNKDLVAKYPFLLRDVDYGYTWLDDVAEGWRKAFGEQMCSELLEILKEADFVNEYHIVEIKEKWGKLTIYSCGVPESIFDKYMKWLNKYEELSENTCIACGAPATHLTQGWVLPMCANCATDF